jgi:hypothetical protein
MEKQGVAVLVYAVAKGIPSQVLGCRYGPQGNEFSKIGLERAAPIFVL